METNTIENNVETKNVVITSESVELNEMQQTSLMESLEKLQKKHNVILAGPSNMAAILHAFQMGFRSIALQRRASEVAETLMAVKTEFGQFEGIMKKMKRNLDLTSKNLDALMGPRAKAINKRLRDVSTMELGAAEELLEIADDLTDNELEE